MILPQMSYEERRREIMTDYQEIYAYQKRQQINQRKEILRHEKFPIYFKQVLYTTKSKNKWVLQSYATSRDYVNDLMHGCYCLMNTSSGYYAVKPVFTEQSRDIAGVYFYTPHFFSRYKLRNDLELDGIDLRSHFFKNNLNVRYGVLKYPEGTYDFDEETHGVTNEGVSLGIREKGSSLIFRTFITFPMLKGNQISTFNLMNELRKEEYEPGYWKPSDHNAPKMKEIPSFIDELKEFCSSYLDGME